jgi:hypothetical protein
MIISTFLPKISSKGESGCPGIRYKIITAVIRSIKDAL